MRKKETLSDKSMYLFFFFFFGKLSGKTRQGVQK